MKLLNRKVLVLLVTVVLISLLSRGARADSLTGWWKLDELSGTVAEDSSGSGNEGTVYGDTEWEDGVMLASLEFDAANDWVDISNPGEYSTEADFTWSAWVRLLDGQVITDGGVIIAKCPANGDYGNGAKCLYVAADGKLEFNVYGVGTLSTETRVNDGLWHHVALTVEFETSGSNDTAKLYIDGELPDDATKNNWNVNEYDESDALKIGFANSNFPQSPDQTYFYGRIDDVRIYDYVLNASEIGGLFEDSGLWRFVVTGDSRDDGSGDGVNDEILGEIAGAIIEDEKADLVVFPGDLVYGYCNQTTLQTQLIKWRDTMQPVYDAGIAVYPVRGNHDVGAPAGVTAWNNVFSGSYALPDNGPQGEMNLTYSVAHKNALIVGMDVYIEAHEVNQDWLDGVLADNTRQHVFVFTHEPAFKVGHDDCLGQVPHDDERNTFWETLEDEPGCRLYFCGHDHFYDHAWIDDSDAETEDVHQMIVGTAGAPLTDNGAYNGENGEWTPTRIKHEKQYGYVVVEIWGELGTNVTAVWMHRTGDGTYEPGGDVFEYTIPCFPTCHPDYGEWVSMYRPNCWCYLRQCHGDADNQKEGSSKTGYYYVHFNDLNVLLAGWDVREPATPPIPSGPGIVTCTAPNGVPCVCADFKHDQEGSDKSGYYRVHFNDLNILLESWSIKEQPDGPGISTDCLDCSRGLAGQQIEKVEPLKIEQIIHWLEELWLEPETQKQIDEDIWLKFIESLKEEL